MLSVPDEGYYVPDEGYYVPDEGYYVPDEGYYVPDEGYSRLSNLSILSVPDEGYYVPDEGYYVPDEGYYVPDGGYSRNASCRLPTFLIRVFLYFFRSLRTVINLYQMNFDKHLIKERTGHLAKIYYSTCRKKIFGIK
jgi:annexin A7/11